MFFPGLAFWDQVLIGIVLIWITVGINLCSLKSSKWVNNVGSYSKFIIFAAMLLAAVMFFLHHGRIANEINFLNILPNLSVAVIFVPIIIYNLLGCELISSAAGEMKNPARDVPKAVILSAIAIAILYLISTLLIWVIVPASEISVSSGIMQMFIIAFGQGWLGKAATIFIGLLVVSTLFTGVVAWTLGQNRSIAEAARNGDMPGLFGLMNKNDAPIGAALLSGTISTIIILVYWFLADNAAEMFWYVTSFCLVLELLAYLFLFPAFVALRQRDKTIKRPYRVPGPNWFAFFLAVLAETFLLLTILLLCIQPGKEFIWAALPIIAGTIIAVVTGEMIINYSLKKNKA